MESKSDINTFGPVTPSAWKLPSTFQVQIIEYEGKINLLQDLINAEYIAISMKSL